MADQIASKGWINSNIGGGGHFSSDFTNCPPKSGIEALPALKIYDTSLRINLQLVPRIKIYYDPPITNITITYDTRGGTTITQQIVTANSNVTISSVVPSKTGTAAFWSYIRSDTGAQVAPGSTISVGTTSITLTAGYYIFSLSNTSANIGINGGTVSTQISSYIDYYTLGGTTRNIGWWIDSYDNSWISISPTSVNNDSGNATTITYLSAFNNSSTWRGDDITFIQSQSNVTRIYSLSQEGIQEVIYVWFYVIPAGLPLLSSIYDYFVSGDASFSVTNLTTGTPLVIDENVSYISQPNFATYDTYPPDGTVYQVDISFGTPAIPQISRIRRSAHGSGTTFFYNFPFSDTYYITIDHAAINSYQISCVYSFEN